MGKHIYRAQNAMAGVAYGELFEAEEDDPRVLSGRVDLVPRSKVPAEVARALAEGADSVPEPVDAPEVPTRGQRR